MQLISDPTSEMNVCVSRHVYYLPYYLTIPYYLVYCSFLIHQPISPSFRPLIKRYSRANSLPYLNYYTSSIPILPPNLSLYLIKPTFKTSQTDLVHYLVLLEENTACSNSCVFICTLFLHILYSFLFLIIFYQNTTM